MTDFVSRPYSTPTDRPVVRLLSSESPVYRSFKFAWVRMPGGKWTPLANVTDDASAIEAAVGFGARHVESFRIEDSTVVVLFDDGRGGWSESERSTFVVVPGDGNISIPL